MTSRPTDTESETTAEIAQAGLIISKGGVVGFPTETFYGLAVDPRSEQAVERLLEIKNRPPLAGIPLIVSDPSQIEKWAIEEDELIKPIRLELQKRFWPGPLTLIVAISDEAASAFALGIFGPEQTIAVRCSGAYVARSLARAAGGVITATSANPKDQPPPTSAEGVRNYFPDLFIVNESEDESPEGVLPSTLLDIRKRPFRILREGAISREALGVFLEG